MESSIRQFEGELAHHKVFLDKIRRISLEEEKKRFRPGLVTNALENNVSVSQIGDALVEILQKCLFDDDNEKKTLQSKLERVKDMLHLGDDHISWGGSICQDDKHFFFLSR